MSTISRRETMAWMGAALASPWVMSPVEPAFAQGEAGLWKDIDLAPITAPGYGTDPNLVKPSVPWPLTLNEGQRASLRIAADLMLPADDRSPSGSALGLDAFIDEWVSAPYPDQQRDRRLILSGLAWLDAGEQVPVSVTALTPPVTAKRRAIFDRIAFKNKVALLATDVPPPSSRRLRGLMLGGFYSRPEGLKDIGYIGNTPSMSYAGPTEEAVAHLHAALAKLEIQTV